MANRSMPELLAWDELKTYFDQRLVKALGHPLRQHILAVLNERTASGSEIGEELGADVSSFYHHIEELEKLGCIERVEARKRRGATEYFFKATRSVFFDEEAWQQLPNTLRADLATSFLQSIFDEVVVALKAGTLNAREDEHVSWAPGRFDLRGWREAKELIDETFDRLATIQRESAARLAKSGELGTPVTVAFLGFRTAPSGGESATGG